MTHDEVISRLLYLQEIATRKAASQRFFQADAEALAMAVRAMRAWETVRRLRLSMEYMKADKNDELPWFVVGTPNDFADPLDAVEAAEAWLKENRNDT